ncbi:GerMN domain-containing protein [Geodermatophilus sabuli]|uniref:Sporulation and spore germination n=1 Tax=Geodermatophilus sabuli TaxID=1564158 RepID=A0A285EB15_9ACTN|nr:GerMN domain-containing protein [Geodermatophilus sabuli]MBB3084433.1 hypothetical protein [Geodermatophilus sabuli]SNX96299.1 Sporulation and spore germination [Geodermatophilus sabuli]
MRSPRRLCVLLVTGVLVGVLAPASAAAAPTAAPAQPTTPTLVGIRAAHHPTFDRIVFDFRGGLPTAEVAYVSELIGDGSGLPVPIAGRAILQARFEPADAHDDSGTPTAPDRVAFALPNIMTTVRSGDFEAVTTYGIGLARREAVTVSTLTDPDRVVIDVGAAFRTVQHEVFFFDEDRFVANQPPFYVAVSRPVLPQTPATGVLDRLFAGPTTAEQAAGLTLLSSGATGFTGLGIRDQVARVQLTGGCSSGGSTETIAGEIFPTLKQFDSVDVVKILDPEGRTGTPDGLSDSIPECLEP